MLKKLALLFAFLFILPKIIFAQDFKSDYKVEYYLNQNEKTISTDVKINVKITNLQNDTYVNKFSLTFPRSFSIKNLTASDDSGQINPTVADDQEKTKVTLEFSNPKTGRASQNNFYLNFKQDNLFQVNGNIWEVILPTINVGENEKYQIVVYLPKGLNRKISVSKPVPDLIDNNAIYWNNPKTKTIYAVFGDKQFYNLSLIYHLTNPRLTRVYTEVALPPDLENQKIYIRSILPKPQETRIDQDGNLLAKYILEPKQNLDVDYKGTAEIFTQYRPEVKINDLDNLNSQTPYLLSESRYWRLNNPSPFKNLKSTQDIYNFLVNSFSYSYQRVGNSKRLGAEEALKNPNLAVCTEFSDAFIALAREKGYYSREIEGFGYTQDTRLRPLSLVSDVLHSWPQYFDKEKQLWISVDPTWENTSGIDYFSSFDLNHIAFAIHGKDSSYPLPAGMYKTKDSKDINISLTSNPPQEIRNVLVTELDVKNIVNKNSANNGSLVIQNLGNTVVYSVPIKIEGQNLAITPSDATVGVIAPYERKKVNFYYKTQGNNLSGSITASTLDGKPVVKNIRILPYSSIYTGFLIVPLLVVMIYLYFRFIKKRSLNVFKRRTKEEELK